MVDKGENWNTNYMGEQQNKSRALNCIPTVFIKLIELLVFNKTPNIAPTPKATTTQNPNKKTFHQ